jgi:integrase/recombinase XerD
MPKNIEYLLAEHNSKPVILIKFGYDKTLIERVKKLVGVKWSNSKKAWYVPDNTEYRERFSFNQKIDASQNTLNQIHEVNQIALQKLVEAIQLKGYSPSTLATYRNEFAQLLIILKDKPVETMMADRLRDYFVYCVNTLKLSENTIHSRINAVKFYFEQVIKREKLFIDIPRPKKKLQLPNVLAISQIEKLFAQLGNLKHRTMLYMAYSAGMRVSEVVALKVNDIHSERMVINIKGAKGKKDRTVNLSEGILILINKYLEQYTPKLWLFEGQYGGQYSDRSLQQTFQRAKLAAKIIQPVTFHSLRHSYATHLHESGTDIKLIQELLGHNDIKTTLRYTHVSKRTIENIKSPFDNLNLNIDGI